MAGVASTAVHLFVLKSISFSRRSQLGDATRENLITLCAECHGKIHARGCILADSSRSN
jgi:predicted HNH restriction endonuclease